MSARRFFWLILAAALSAGPAVAGWQEELKAGVDEIRAGRASSGVDAAYVALLRNQVPANERAKAVMLLTNLLFQGDLDELAAKFLDQVIAEDQENRDTYLFCRGMLHERNWRFDLAVADYEQSLVHNPANLSALLALGRLRLNCPEPRFVDAAQALSLAQRAVKAANNPAGRAAGHLLAARALAESGQFDQAIASQTLAVKEAEGNLTEVQVGQLRSVLADLRRRAQAAGR